MQPQILTKPDVECTVGSEIGQQHEYIYQDEVLDYRRQTHKSSLRSNHSLASFLIMVYSKTIFGPEGYLILWCVNLAVISYLNFLSISSIGVINITGFPEGV